MRHERFHYATLCELRAAAQAAGAWLPLSEDVSPLLAPLPIVPGVTAKNRLALQPMEGSDAAEGGAPGALTQRRYRRFAEGGAGLIWFEAVAIAPEVRASARQLLLTEQNLDDFRRLTDLMREIGLRQNGYAPVIVLQATHSGRYAKPEGVPAPIIAYNNPLFEGDAPIDPARIVTDEALERCEARYAGMARLALAAGFDGMDVKCCHRYLASELLSAYERKGPYGGPFENRARFFLNCCRAARAEARGSFFVTSRMNAYDGYPHPYGFGVAEGQGAQPDLTEAKRLARILAEEIRVPLLNITIGNPYTNPHVNRPYDAGNYVPDEHPLTGVSRMMRCVAEVQAAIPKTPVMGSAFSYLRAFSPLLAAGMVRDGHAALAGFGRMAFANPDFPNQVRRQGRVEEKQVCIACGKCAGLLRQGKPAGCVVRDREVYQG